MSTTAKSSLIVEKTIDTLQLVLCPEMEALRVERAGSGYHFFGTSAERSSSVRAKQREHVFQKGRIRQKVLLLFTDQPGKGRKAAWQERCIKHCFPKYHGGSHVKQQNSNC